MLQKAWIRQRLKIRSEKKKRSKITIEIIVGIFQTKFNVATWLIIRHLIWVIEYGEDYMLNSKTAPIKKPVQLKPKIVDYF